MSGAPAPPKPWAKAGFILSEAPRSAKLRRVCQGSELVKALEPYNPCFYEQIVQPLNVEIMAELARRTGAGRG